MPTLITLILVFLTAALFFSILLIFAVGVTEAIYFLRELRPKKREAPPPPITTIVPCSKHECRHYREYRSFGPIISLEDKRTRLDKFLGTSPMTGYALPICRDCKHFERFELYAERYDAYL